MLKNWFINLLSRKSKEVCLLSAVRQEDKYLSGFLSHVIRYVDEIVLFNDRPLCALTACLDNKKIIEVRHTIVQGQSVLTVYRRGKQDRGLQEKVDNILHHYFTDVPCNFTLSNVPSLEAYYNEKKVRQFLVLFAQQLRYKVALCADADERFETKFLLNLRREVKRIYKEKKCYGLHFRELWGGVTTYRCDGIWNLKIKYVFFPLRGEVLTFNNTMKTNIHTFWHYDQIHQLENLDYNIYHLKMITAEDRAKRVALYNHLDPTKKYQAIGYDYLTDEEGILLKKVDRKEFSLT